MYLKMNENNNHNKDYNREMGGFEARIVLLEKNQDTYRRETEMKIESQKKENDARFDKVDNKIDQKFKEVDAKLESVKSELNTKMDRNIKVVLNNFNDAKKELSKIDEKLDHFQDNETFKRGFIKAVCIGAAILISSGSVITLVIKVIYPHLT